MAKLVASLVSHLTQLGAWVPFAQSLLWCTLVVGAAVAFRRDLRELRTALVERLKRGAAIKVGPVELGELRKDLDIVSKKADDATRLVGELFLATMSGDMYRNLEKLTSPSGFGRYTITEGLTRELYHLRDIGYIEVGSIRGIPRDGPNLSEHVKVTATGQQFVALRRRIDVARATPSEPGPSSASNGN